MENYDKQKSTSNSISLTILRQYCLSIFSYKTTQGEWEQLNIKPLKLISLPCSKLTEVIHSASYNHDIKKSPNLKNTGLH